MNQSLQEYVARCHCGALSARFRTSLSPANWSLRACQCAFCRAHGALTVADPAGDLEFGARAPEQLHRYRFGTRTADFLLCRECGVYVGARSGGAGGGFGILNVRALRPIPADLSAPVPLHQPEETPEGRRERRQAHWTPLTLPFL